MYHQVWTLYDMPKQEIFRSKIVAAKLAESQWADEYLAIHGSWPWERGYKMHCQRWAYRCDWTCALIAFKHSLWKVTQVHRNIRLSLAVLEAKKDLSGGQQSKILEKKRPVTASCDRKCIILLIFCRCSSRVSMDTEQLKVGACSCQSVGSAVQLAQFLSFCPLCIRSQPQ